MIVQDLIGAMERIAPPRLAENWDNVGLLLGRSERNLRAAMLCIDLTQAVLAEAKKKKCQAVVAYHPTIFHGLKKITGGVVMGALESGVAVYSPHTALDVAEGGTNDFLADILELENRLPVRPTAIGGRHFKLITFVPEAQAEAVAEAIFAAGAGHIGRYSHCSFRSQGVGTFLGQAGTHPTVGRPGKLERTEEIRLETVLPLQKASAVIKALHQSHPYEEPAFDLQQLAAAPEGLGLGRIGDCRAVSRKTVLGRIKKALGVKQLLVAGPNSGRITRAACGAGAGGELLEEAICQGAQLYLTGELRHHDALRAAEAGVTVAAALHSNSERAYLPRLKRRLRELLPSLATHISRQDRDPFVIE